MPATLRIANDVLAVDVLPDKGADIYAIVDQRSGIDILFKTPWHERGLASHPLSYGDSQVDWLARYLGGWQQLVPNAGPARTRDGVLRGYHGEAATAAWQVVAITVVSARLSVDLLTAPLRLSRELAVEGPRLRVCDTITNVSPDPVEVSWVQHPAFGAPFIDHLCSIESGARTVLTDAEAPGTMLPPDSVFPFPLARSVEDEPVDLRAVPAPGSGSSVFAALSDFDRGWFAINSPTAGFGVRLDWDTAVLPHAWLWQECHASRGFPWFRRAYVVAVEPANVLPGDPSRGCRDRGRAPILGAGAVWRAELSLSRIPLT